MAAWTWDPDPIAFHIPIIDHPIAWYGIIFAAGFFVGYSVLLRLFQYHVRDADPRALADRLLWVSIVATIVGARLGEVFFYDWPYYRENPMAILMTWRGGLASHGGAAGIIIGTLLYRWSIRDKEPGLSLLRIFDCMVIATALIGMFIRLGNFVNQEILGTLTDVPWAVIMGHPRDGSAPAPRHPAQLYEAAWYGLCFLLLWFRWQRHKETLADGRLFGLFLVLVFGFRFFVEFWKAPQSLIVDPNAALRMGQWLSIPFVLAGIWLLIRKSPPATQG